MRRSMPSTSRRLYETPVATTIARVAQLVAATRPLLTDDRHDRDARPRGPHPEAEDLGHKRVETLLGITQRLDEPGVEPAQRDRLAHHRVRLRVAPAEQRAA